MNHSLRMRLIVGAVGASLLILPTMGGGLYLVVKSRLSRQFDHTLLIRALATAASLDWDNQNGRLRVHLDSNSGVGSRGGTALHTLPRLVEIWNARRRVIYRSPALRDADLAYIPVTDAGPVYRSFRLSEDHRGREVLLAIGADANADGDQSSRSRTATTKTPLVLAVGHHTGSLTAALNIVFWSVLLACLAATGLLAATLSLITRRSLKPLETLAARIGRVAVDDLSERVEISSAPGELLPVIDRLNDLLARLEETLVREKALTADIAHELRTPLAAIQTGLEVNLSRPRDVEAYRATLQSTLGIARQMENMVANLLTLSRAESGTLRLAPQTVAVGGLVESLLSEYSPAFADKGVRVITNLDAGVEISTDPAAMETIVRNVLDNATAYVDIGGTVEVGVQRSPGGVQFRVANTGSDISPQDAPHVLERFWRGDKARSGGGVHCGLGLSLVWRLAHLLGGTASVTSQPGGQFVIVVSIGNL